MKINLNSFRKEYESYDGKREKLIKQARVVLKSSKQLIYSIHRDNKNEAIKYEKDLKKEFNSLLSIQSKDEKLGFEGSLKEASEEYAEGMLYFDYCYKSKLRNYEELKVSQESYIGALSDLTGELGRKSVQLAIKKKYEQVYIIQEFVSNIFKEMLTFNFRNGNLRKKSDAIKWNLNKIEDVIYDIETKGKQKI